MAWITAIKPLRVARAAAILGSTLLAAGCFYDETDLTTTRPLVQWQDTAHHVSFPPDSAELSHDEAVALNRFVAGMQDSQDTRVTILVGREAEQQRNALQRQRGEVIAAYLREQGHTARIAAVPGSAYRQSVVVSAARLTVVTPDCPDWERIRRGGTMIGGREQFGCVTAASLGSMVANPRDLIQGRPMGPTDAVPQARGVREYRSGELGAQQRREGFSTREGQ